MTSDIMIIGAGASGLMAAISAARISKKKNTSIIIFERMDKPGKKILATGNGRCNFTNQHMDAAFFRSSTASNLSACLNNFGYNETIEFFEALGIVPKSRDGYMYPNSNQASAVLDVLLMEIERLNIHIKTGTYIQTIKSNRNGYELWEITGEKHLCKKLIVAGGGCANPKLGSDGSCYQLAKKLGHTLITPVPALTGLHAKETFFKSVSGVRTDGKITIYCDGTYVSHDRGELQLTDYGVSGIPAFQVSRYASQALSENRSVTADIDFYPDLSQKDFLNFLKSRIQLQRHKTCRQFLIGMFNSKLCDLFLKQCKITPDLGVIHLNPVQLEQLVRIIKQMHITIIKTGDFSNAQVCAGGVSCKEITADFESKLHSGLYLCGELLDVDGMCGGYNLQWAWTSGYIAGSHAGKEL